MPKTIRIQKHSKGGIFMSHQKYKNWKYKNWQARRNHQMPPLLERVIAYLIMLAIGAFIISMIAGSLSKLELNLAPFAGPIWNIIKYGSLAFTIILFIANFKHHLKH